MQLLGRAHDAAGRGDCMKVLQVLVIHSSLPPKILRIAKDYSILL
jgi:hypothetical protein